MRATICGLGEKDAVERLTAVLLALGADWHGPADAAAPGGRAIHIAGHAARVFTEGDALALEGRWEAVHPVVAAYNRSAEPATRSFRLFTLPTESAYARFAGDYSEEDRQSMALAFKPHAARRRMLEKIGLAFGICFMLAVACGMLFGREHIAGFVLLGLLFWLCTVAFMTQMPEFLCPGCSRKLLREIRRHCPECGHRGIVEGQGGQTPHCFACGSDFRAGKGRSYSIRHCTHCGLKVDEQGF